MSIAGATSISIGDVAIKVIGQAVEGFADRFRIEAAALGRLKHPHIVDVMDFGVEEARGIAYLVMELLEGVTLARTRRASPRGPIPSKSSSRSRRALTSPTPTASCIGT